ALTLRPAPAGRNRVMSLLGHAAAGLAAGRPAQTLADLGRIDEAFADPAERRALSFLHTTPAEAARTYDLLRLGLRGQAERATGQVDAAWRTLSARLALLGQRAGGRVLDDDLLALSLSAAQL